MEALSEGGQGPEEAAVPYMDGMNGQIQQNGKIMVFCILIFRFTEDTEK